MPAEDRRFARLLTAMAVALLVPVAVLYLGSGLVAPAWAVSALWVLFVVGLVVLWRAPARWRPAVPVALGVSWVLVVSLGAQLGGWTA